MSARRRRVATVAAARPHPPTRPPHRRARPSPPKAPPPGYRYSDESAVPCGFGSYKAGVDFSTVCTRCGAGLTTATTTASAAADCRLARPGYRLIKSGGDVAGAAACGKG